MVLHITCTGTYGVDVLDYAKAGDPMGTVVFEGFGRTFTYQGGEHGLNLERARPTLAMQIVTDLKKVGAEPNVEDVKTLCARAFHSWDGGVRQAEVPECCEP